MYFVTAPRPEMHIGEVENISIAIQFLPDLDIKLCEVVVEGAGVWQARLVKLGVTHVAETLVASFQVRPTMEGTMIARLRVVYVDPGNTVVAYASDLDPTPVGSLVTQRDGVVFGNVSIPVITVRSGPTYPQLAASLSDLGSAYSSLESKFVSLQDRSSRQETITMLLEAALIVSVAANGFFLLKLMGIRAPDWLQLRSKRTATHNDSESSLKGADTVAQNNEGELV